MAITLREGLGRKLTIAEMDENFSFLSSSYVVNSITASMTAGNAESASVAARATLLSADATASIADFATSASIADDIKTGLAISASALDITGNMSVAGTASFAYLESVTGSAKIIGDALIILNNNTPAERYAGIVVQDSGSTSDSASLLFDGETNDWFYEYTDDGGANYEYAVGIFGPEYDTKGTPTYLTSESVVVSQGGHHVTSSIISVSDGVMTVEGTITETSALRYKENIQPLQDTLTKVNQLNPVEYDWIRDGKHDLGLIAEEVNEIYPDLVEVKDGEVQSIHYSRLTAVLIGAIKELTARVEELENK